MSPRHLCAGALQVLLLGVASPAIAQDFTADAPAGAPPPAGTWPRMFFAPEERRLVTLLRQEALEGGRPVAGPAAQQAGTQAAVVRHAPPRVNGISLVHGARFAAWIGGRRVGDGGRWDGYRLRVTRDGVEFIDAAGVARLVKVGQPVRPAGGRAP